MKTVVVIFTIVGWLLIFFQILSYVGPMLRDEPIFDQTDIPYIIGCNLFVILGFGFLFIANRQRKKIRVSKERGQLDSFLNEHQKLDG